MVAGCTHPHCPSSAGRGTIVVVTGLRCGTGVEVRLVNKITLALDYLIRWDYIVTRGNGVGLTSQLPLH